MSLSIKQVFYDLYQLITIQQELIYGTEPNDAWFILRKAGLHYALSHHETSQDTGALQPTSW